MSKTAPQRLQGLIWPEPGLSTERDMYVRLRSAALSMPECQVHFCPGGLASFSTYFNLFNIGKWVKYCALSQLSLALSGKGRFELTVIFAQPETSREQLITDVITLEQGQPHICPIDPACFEKPRGVLFFELRALSDGHLSDAVWQTDQPPLRHPDLTLSITTFQREEAVQNSVARFKEFIKTSDLADHLHLIVVDNGQTAEIEPSRHVTPVLNENLGGSGGFSRGLLEARDRGSSHCLFMDDDACVHMQSIERTWTFLAYATAPETCVAGALSHAQYRWKLWENGAIFRLYCRPLFAGTDLRRFGKVLKMEFESTDTPPDDSYGAWWFFAFPVNQAQHMPFPFFVRGDDVGFGIINPFTTISLPGVMSFQDEDFSSKESGQSLYLDVRSHLGLHLGVPSLQTGRLDIVKILAVFFLRGLLTCHYDSLKAINIGVRDAIEGPDFFARNADMIDRRKQLAEITKDEKWRRITGTLPPEKTRLNMDRHWLRGVMKITLNGHLLPFFARFGNHITLPSTQRGSRHAVWGAAQITYVDATGKYSYTVHHSKRKALCEGWSMARNTFTLLRDHDSIQERWRSGFARLTTESFWRDILKMT